MASATVTLNSLLADATICGWNRAGSVGHHRSSVIGRSTRFMENPAIARFPRFYSDIPALPSSEAG
jgi:hypothetical protein